LPTVFADFNFQKSSKNKGCYDFSNQRKDQFTTLLLSKYSEKEKVDEASVVVRFLSAPGSRHVSHLIRTIQGSPVDHSSEYHLAISEAIPLSEDTATPGILILQAPS